MINHQKIINAVEDICSTGCSSVNAIIVTLEAGNKLKGFDGFNKAEMAELKNELKSIMAVYDARNIND